MNSQILKNLTKEFKKALVITHTDLDGYGAGAILNKTLLGIGYRPEDIKIVNTDYNNPLPFEFGYDLILISDISISTEKDAKRLIEENENPDKLVIWLDHHGTSIDMSKKFPKLKEVCGIRDINGCGTMLAWIFHQMIELSIPQTSMKTIDYELSLLNIESIVKSKVPGIIPHGANKIKKTPKAILLTDDYDRFILSDQRSIHLMESFNCHQSVQKDCKGKFWTDTYLDMSDNNKELDEIISFGEVIYLWKCIHVLNDIKTHAQVVSFKDFPDIDIVMHNSVNKGSLMFGGLLNYNNDKSRTTFNFGSVIKPVGENMEISIYSTPSQKKVNAVAICKKYGGGGHDGAAGCKIPMGSFYRSLSKTEPLSEKIRSEISEEIVGLIKRVSKIVGGN